MADGATVSSPSVVRPSRISGPGCQAAPERPLFVLWISVDTGISAMPRARHGAGATEVLDRWDTVSSPIVRAPLGALDDDGTDPVRSPCPLTARGISLDSQADGCIRGSRHVLRIQLPPAPAGPLPRSADR